MSALIGALYAVLTIAIAPLSYGLMQVRIAEGLCVLPYYSFSAVPGLFVGCLIANLIGGANMLDVLFGSLATLFASLLTYLMGKLHVNRLLCPLPAVVLNAFTVGALLCYVYNVGVGYMACVGYVAAGQLIACYGVGAAVMWVTEKYLKGKWL